MAKKRHENQEQSVPAAQPKPKKAAHRAASGLPWHPSLALVSQFAGSTACDGGFCSSLGSLDAACLAARIRWSDRCTGSIHTTASRQLRLAAARSP